MMFHWKIESLDDIYRVATEPWTTAFYRPINALSASIDYSIWGVNPFGWYMTNLMLHILTAVSLFFLMLSLTRGSLFIAWLSAVIFTTHPILMNDVLVIPYRQDILPATFIILSLLFFLKFTYDVSAKKHNFFISLFFCVLALGSKETAIITPFIIFTYVVTFTNERFHKKKILEAISTCLPFFLITFLYFIWRLYLLHGMAGYGRYVKLSVFTRVQKYFSYLLDPIGLSNLKLQCLIILVFFVFLFFKQDIKKHFTDSIHRKLLFFLLVWILLPLGVYLLTLGVIDSRQVYIPAPAFSGLLAVVFVESLRAVINKTEKNQFALIKNLIAFSVTLGLIVYFLIYSPLIKNYREVENCGKVCKAVLHQLLEMVPNLPEDTTIYINNLPNNIYTNGGTPIYDSSCFESGNYKKFLDYYHPENHIKIIPHYAVWRIDTNHPLDVDSEIRFDIKENKDEKIVEMDIKITSDKITTY